MTDSCPSGTYGCNCGSVSVWQQEGGYQALVAMGTIAVLTGFVIVHISAIVRVLVPDLRGHINALVQARSERDFANANLMRFMRAVDALVALFFLLGSMFVASALTSPLRQGGYTSRPFIDYSGGVAFAWIAFAIALLALVRAVHAVAQPSGACTGPGGQFFLVAAFRFAWVMCAWTFATQVNPDFGAGFGVILLLYTLVVTLLMYTFTRIQRAEYKVGSGTQSSLEEGIRLMQQFSQRNASALGNDSADDVQVTVPTKDLRRVATGLKTGGGIEAAETARNSGKTALYTLIVGVVDILFFSIPGTVVFMRVGCTWGQ